MAGSLLAKWRDGARLGCIADGLVVAIAASLPWSTSAVSILSVLWVVAVIPTLKWAEFRQVLTIYAGALPVLLVAFGVLGMLWADVAWIERWGGLGSFLKLLAIPLLFAQFRRSDCGKLVFIGYGVSCVILLAISTAAQFVPGFTFIPVRWDNTIVRNAPTQGGEFVTCVFGLLFLVIKSFELRRWSWSLCFLALSLAMLANILYVANGRTALVIIPILIALLAFKTLRFKGVITVFVCAILVGGLTWASSSYLRKQTMQIWSDFKKYDASGVANSSGERVEFYKKSVEFIVQAPLFGHGTGSIHSLFVKSAIGQTGAAASQTTNPHNQTFAVAIQIGVLGATLLWAMWIAHLMLFRGRNLVEWIGLVVVVQNIVGSLFNSHLFDFVQGWVYVVGIGVAGGMVLQYNLRKLESLSPVAQNAPN